MCVTTEGTLNISVVTVKVTCNTVISAAINTFMVIYVSSSHKRRLLVGNIK